MENLKSSWKKSWKVLEFEELKRVRTPQIISEAILRTEKIIKGDVQ